MVDLEGRDTIFSQFDDERCIDELRKLHEAQIDVLRRTYFRRSWVRQEIGVAAEAVVQCGESDLSWETLKRLADRLTKTRTMLKDMKEEKKNAVTKEDSISGFQYLTRGGRRQLLVGDYGQIGGMWQSHGGGFLEYLMVGRELSATDPRDKINHLLNLSNVPISHSPQTMPFKSQAGDERRETMAVDYARTVPEAH
ncbi:hypothetical protein BDZ45DRAFT_62076 [Acephala macrosclerotiorum]|nr:hypothetical protein BDZ45DRAFT_62076 [Acephala macrosclerotiorum]